MPVRVAVLGATGSVGTLIVDEALSRGLLVTALARRPELVTVRPGLTVVPADVHQPDSIARAVVGHDVLLSGLGSGKDAGVLAIGAKAAVASGIERIVWLGAWGTGPSAAAAGMLTRTMLSVVMKNELPDKVEADATILAAGGTLFHIGPMKNGSATGDLRTVRLDEAPKSILPRAVSRASVASAMVDEAQQGRFPGLTVTLASA